jgi:serine/threonine protein kinase
MSYRSDGTSSGLPSPPGTPSRKPLHPYVAGFTFIAKRHEVPTPFGWSYSKKPPADHEKLSTSDQVQWCRSHPPATGTTRAEDTIRISVKEPLRTGMNDGAQVVLTEDGQVAKIYDPLYYAFYPKDGLRKKIDVTTEADSDYSIEVAAYLETQQSHVQGTVMPTFYGSWTFDLTTCIDDEELTREVRMILIEHVPGIQMLDLDPSDLSQEERENIMRKVIEADYDLRYAGVEHDDLSPRNIMISQVTALSDPDLRVTFVDFGLSLVYRIHFGGPALREYHNPLFCWTSASMWSSWGWLPFEEEDYINWMWGLWGDGQGGKYVKVERNPDSDLGRPKKPARGKEADSLV